MDRLTRTKMKRANRLAPLIPAVPATVLYAIGICFPHEFEGDKQLGRVIGIGFMLLSVPFWWKYALAFKKAVSDERKEKEEKK